MGNEMHSIVAIASLALNLATFSIRRIFMARISRRNLPRPEEKGRKVIRRIPHPLLGLGIAEQVKMII